VDLGAKRAFKDTRGLGQSLSRIAAFHHQSPAPHQVPLRVHAGSVRAQRLFSIKDGGQHLILDADQAQGILRQGFALRRHHGHLITHKTHDVIEGEQVRINRHGWHITMRQHHMHSGQAHCLRDIDIDNTGMGMRAAQRTSVQHSRPFEIRGVACFPLDLVHQAHTRNNGTHYCQIRTHSPAPPQLLCRFMMRPATAGLPPALPP
jgi:hypothetical protein